ncbi:MAG: lysophospholipase [Firmicutes bacterium]|nr:lysophospholipase [Bacillota bacterium]MDH7495147.1 alpha/beta hydrolase [Bacillota bacterium]
MEASETGFVNGTGGVKLFYQCWLPDGAVPKAAIVITHGGAEHSGRYQSVVEHLLPRGFAIWGLDNRGHGRSEGRRGHVDRYDQLVDDLASFCEFVRERTPATARLFLLGHSIGGLTALSYAVKHGTQDSCPVEGLIVSGPCLALSMKVPWLKETLGRAVERVFPTVTVDAGIPAQAISRDPEVVAAYVGDPLRNPRITLRFYIELTRQMTKIMAAAPFVQLPCLILQGGRDGIVSPYAARRFYSAMTCRDREIRVYPESFHEVLNDVNKAEVLADVTDWLARHSASRW